MFTYYYSHLLTTLIKTRGVASYHPDYVFSFECIMSVLHPSSNRMEPSIYDVHTDGERVRLRWTHVDGGSRQLHVYVHTEHLK